MAKREPAQRWHDEVRERFIALKLSPELRALRRRGLALLGRRRLYTQEEWWTGRSQREAMPDYWKWVDECSALADRFGLMAWVVVDACLVKGFAPDRERLAFEAEWPCVRVVTQCSDSLFLQKLSYEAQRRGMYVIRNDRGSEATIIHRGYGEVPEELPPSSMPPLRQAFYIRVETPAVYPPEAAVRLQRSAQRAARELLRCLGYPVPRRLRSSTLVAMAPDLKVGEKPLQRERLRDMVVEQWPDDETAPCDVDEGRRKLLKSRRHRLGKRLVDGYRK